LEVKGYSEASELVARRKARARVVREGHFRIETADHGDCAAAVSAASSDFFVVTAIMWKNFTRNTMERLGDIVAPPVDSDEEEYEEEMEEDEDINSQDEYYVEGEEEEEEEERSPFGFVGMLKRALDKEEHDHDESHEEEDLHPEETVDLHYNSHISAEPPISGGQEIQDHHSMLADHRQSHAFVKKDPLLGDSTASGPTPPDEDDASAEQIGEQERNEYEPSLSKSPVPNTFLKREAGSIVPPASPSNRSHSHRSHSLSLGSPVSSTENEQPVTFMGIPDRDLSDRSERTDMSESEPVESPSPPQITVDRIGNSGALSDKPLKEPQTQPTVGRVESKEETGFVSAFTQQDRSDESMNGDNNFVSIEKASERPVKTEPRSESQAEAPFTEPSKQMDNDGEKQVVPTSSLEEKDGENVKTSETTTSFDDRTRDPQVEVDSSRLTPPSLSAEPMVLPFEELTQHKELNNNGNLSPKHQLGSAKETEALTAGIGTGETDSQAEPVRRLEISGPVVQENESLTEEPVMVSAGGEEHTHTSESTNEPPSVVAATAQGESIQCFSGSQTLESPAIDLKRTEELEQHCLDVEKQLKQAERHIVELQQQASRQMEEEERQHQLFQEKEVRLLRAAAEDHQLQMDALQRQMDDTLEAMQNEMEQERALAARRQEELQRLMKEANARAESAVREKQKTLAQHESSSTQHQMQQERALRMAEDKLAQTMAVLDDREEQVKHLKTKIQHLESEMSEHGHGLHEAEEEIDELHHENESLRQHVQRTESQCSELQAKIVELQHDSEKLSHVKVTYLVFESTC